MPTYGSERAVILPQLQNASEPGWRAIENIQQNQRVAEEKRRYEQQRQDQMLEWALGQMDFKNFATGTVLDPTIHQSLDGALKGVTEKIMNGGYTNNAAMMYDVKNSVSDVAQYSMKAKNMRALIDENVKAFSKNPAIDQNKLRNLAYANTFLKYDPEGHVVGVKSAQEIDDSSDPVSDLIQNSPERIYTGAQSLYESLPKLNNKDVGEVYKRRDKAGRLVDTEYKGKLYEHQEMYQDKEGNWNSRVKQKPVTFSDGTQAEGLADDAFNRIFGSGDNQIVLNAEFNKRYKDAIQSGQIKREDIPALKSAFALNMIKTSDVGGITNKDIVQERMPSLRVTNNISTGTTAPVRDIYGIINNMASERQGRNLQVNLLPIDAQQRIVDIANKLGPVRKDDAGKEVPYTQASVYIKKENNGLVLRDATQNKVIAVLDEASLNVGMQPTAKGKNAVISDTNKDNSGGYQEVKYDQSVVDKAFKKHGYIKEATVELRKLGYSEMQIKEATKRMVQLKSGKSSKPKGGDPLGIL